MTYASDLGLKVGSKIKYLVGGELEEHHDFNFNSILTLVDDPFENEAPRFKDNYGVSNYFDLSNHIWEHYNEEKEMNKRLERDQGYDVKLTGEEIVLIGSLLAATNGRLLGRVYETINDLLDNSLNNQESPGLPTIDLHKYEGELLSYVTKMITPVETEDQRKLRELKEQYAKLGESIAAMEKK